MKKGDGPNAGEEFFYKLSRSREFQQDLIRARKQLGIYEKGFSDPRTREKLWIKNKHADMFGLFGIELHLKEKYKIPTPYWQFIDDYIFFGQIVSTTKNKIPVAMVAPNTPPGFGSIEDFYDANNEPYVKLFIFNNASKTKVVDFVKNNWREIELGLNINIHNTKRVRTTIYKKRNRTIRELWKVPLVELQREAQTGGDKIITKERDLLVSKILVKRGLTPSELSGGTIRRIANEK